MKFLLHRISTFIACSFCAVVVAACGNGDTTAVGNDSGPLFTSAPSAISLAIGQTTSYTAGGGGGTQNYTTYSVSSSNSSIASVTISGAAFSITGVSAGTATIEVLDTAGSSVSTTVTVSASGAGGSGGALYIAAPANVYVGQSSSANYTVGGGSGTYTAASSDTAVAKATLTGTTLTVTGVSGGTATIAVFDGTGKSTSIGVNVAASNGAQSFYTTAPSTITVAIGARPTYEVIGGVAPYTATTSNVVVATGSISGNSLTIAGLSAGTATIEVFDTTGATISVAVTVGGNGVASTLYTTAPSPLTVAAGTAPTYTVSGGVAPYSVSTSDLAVATGSVFGSTLTITGVSAGSATIEVFDSAGLMVSVSVSVSGGSGASTLYTTALSNVTIGIGKSAIYNIGGGTGPYSASSSNAVAVGTSVTGTQLTISGGNAAGTSQVAVFDSTGHSVQFAVTVTSGTLPAALYTTAPSAITVGVGANPSYGIGGGAAPYTVTSGAVTIATVSLTGSTFTVTGVAAGTTEIAIVDSLGVAVDLSVTVP